MESWLAWLRAIARACGQRAEDLPVDDATELARTAVEMQKAPCFLAFAGHRRLRAFL